MLKAHLETWPVLEAFRSGDECPFCYAVRDLERRSMEFTVGPSSSYMQRDIRSMTDEAGFCARHLKGMYDYGNLLGDALILQTHEEKLLQTYRKKAAAFQPPRRGFLGIRKKDAPGEENGGAELVRWLRERKKKCFLCARVEESYRRYLETFFYMLRDAEFRKLVEESRGFCMEHLADLLEYAGAHLTSAHEAWFYDTVFRLTEENLGRVRADLDWFVKKHDYRNAGESWKNARDAVPRMMQKLAGGYPSDPPLKGK